jgi:hypothetical protein
MQMGKDGGNMGLMHSQFNFFHDELEGLAAMTMNIAIKPVLTFKTSKGSQYWMDKKGRSQRYKTYHPEHGYVDQGMQDIFHHVIFVDNKDASRLVAATYRHNKWRMFIRRGQVGILSFDSEQKYKLVSGPFDFSHQPAVGFAPIEFQQSENSSRIQGQIVNSKIHVGNRIVTVRYLNRRY